MWALGGGDPDVTGTDLVFKTGAQTGSASVGADAGVPCTRRAPG